MRLIAIELLEADFFSWYLDAWTGKMAEAMRGAIRGQADFESATPVLGLGYPFGWRYHNLEGMRQRNGYPRNGFAPRLRVSA